MNALDHLRARLKPPPNALFHDLLTIVSQDKHVQASEFYAHMTSSGLYRLISAMWQGMDFAAVKWGVRAVPYDLVFACDVDEGAGLESCNRMFIGEALPAREPVLYVTNTYAARMIMHGVLGNNMRFDHMLDGTELPAFHVMALQTIEECLHAEQYRRGMRPKLGSTLTNRDDPVEQEARDLMPEIIREFRFVPTLDH